MYHPPDSISDVGNNIKPVVFQFNGTRNGVEMSKYAHYQPPYSIVDQ
jgi:hypothetical protein